MNPASRYRDTQASTANPRRLMILLFEHALRMMRQGRQALEAGDRAGGSAALTRATEIVTELAATFDATKAPELGERLGELYAFVSLRLLDAGVRGDPRAVEEAERVFAPLAEAFGDAVREVEGQGP